MIVKIIQTKTNLKQEYDVEGENFYFSGKLGSYNTRGEITLSNSKTTINGIFCSSSLLDYIPFGWLLNGESVTRKFEIYKDGNITGNIVLFKDGFSKSFYAITLESGEVFHCYFLSKGDFDYVNIYEGEKQIALIETYLSVNDFKYKHKLYILDDYDKYAEVLSFFVLYYANYKFAKRFQFSKGSYYEKSWSYSEYNDKYDSKWRETNFPDENFFGKTNLFE